MEDFYDYIKLFYLNYEILQLTNFINTDIITIAWFIKIL
jgi:hypothetical protein